MSAARKLTTWEEPDAQRVGLRNSSAANDNAIEALEDARENSHLGIFVFAHTSLPACEPANDGIAAAKSEARSGTAAEPGITGKEEDVEVGLQYFGKRYLNPLLGRWVSADPLAVHLDVSTLEQRREQAKVKGENEEDVTEAWREWPDLNVYAYVKQQPLRNVDPVGLEDVDGVDPKNRSIIEGVCAAYSCRNAFRIARNFGMKPGGMAEHMLNRFLDGSGRTVHVNLRAVMLNDAGFTARIRGEMGRDLQAAASRGDDIVGQTGMVFVRQGDYSKTEAGEDHKRALGGTYVYYQVTGVKDGKVQARLYLHDSYFWSPGDHTRPTQCLHQCGADMVASGDAKEFLQVGQADFEMKAPEQVMSVDSAPEKQCSGDC